MSHYKVIYLQETGKSDKGRKNQNYKGISTLSLCLSAILVKKIKDPVYAGIIPSVLTITLFIEALLATCPTSIFQDSPQPDGKHIPSCFWLEG